MAFDLQVSGFPSGKAGAKARKKVQKLVDRHRCEAARNMALSYAHLGRLAEGKRRYEECIAELGDPSSLLHETGRAELAEALALFG